MLSARSSSHGGASRKAVDVMLFGEAIRGGRIVLSRIDAVSAMVWRAAGMIDIAGGIESDKIAISRLAHDNRGDDVAK